MECLFCKIIDGNIPSYKIYEDDNVYAFLDINPKGTGHTLVIPKKHTLDITTVDDNTIKEMFKVVKILKKRIADKLNPDGMTIATNTEITQDIKHFHIHLIPVYKKDLDLTVEEVYSKLKKD